MPNGRPKRVNSFDPYQLLEKSHEAIVVLDSEKYIYVNRAAWKLLGFNDENELLARNPIESIAPEYQSLVAEYANNRRSGKPAPESFMLKLVKKDGSTVTVESSVFAMEIDGENVSVAINRDISERIEYEDRLEALHAYGSKISNSGSYEEVAHFTQDAIESVFGHQYNDFNVVQGDTIIPINVEDETLSENLVLDVDGPGIIVRAYRTGEPQLVHDTRLDEDYVYGRGENSEWLSELAVPVKVGDEVVAVINLEHRELGAFSENDQKLVEILAIHVASAFENIRARTQQIHEAEKLERIRRQHTQELIRGARRISMHVRTTMQESVSRVNNLLYLMRENPDLTETYIDELDEIFNKSSQTMLELTKKTLIGELRVALDDIDQIIQNALRAANPPGNIAVSYEPQFSVIEADSHMITSAIEYLIENSIEAMPKGGTLSIEVTSSNGEITVSITDTGQGIDPGGKEMIFTPFFTTKPGGTGLGLTYCREVVLAHGGSISFESNEDSTSFFVTLPQKSRGNAIVGA